MVSSWKIKCPNDVCNGRNHINIHRETYSFQANDDWKSFRSNNYNAAVAKMLDWKSADTRNTGFFFLFFVVVVYLIITWISHLYNINIYYIKEMWVALCITLRIFSFTSFIYLVYFLSHILISRKYYIHFFCSGLFTTYTKTEGNKNTDNNLLCE